MVAIAPHAQLGARTPRSRVWWLLPALLFVPFACRERPAIAQTSSTPIVGVPGAEQIGTCAALARVVPESAGRSVDVVADTLLTDPRGGPDAWRRSGCLLSVIDTASRAGAPVNLLDDWFRSKGWESGLAYGADGPDGTMFAFAGAGELCVIEGRWDGGDDSEPTVVPAPGFVITVGCVAQHSPGRTG
jgi:hypothetical protein